MLGRSILPLGMIGLVFSAYCAGAEFDCGNRPIKLAFYEFGLLYEQGKGIDKDLIEELAKRTHCRFETQLMPRARIWSDLASGALDMSVSGIETPERNQFAWFAPYLSIKNYALVDTNLAKSVNSPAAFLASKEAQFGVVRSFKHGAEQDAFLGQMRAMQRVQDSPDVDALYNKLKEHRVSGIFSQPVVFRRNLGKFGLEKYVAIQDWTPNEKGLPHGLILAKSAFTEEQANAWRAQINALKADGTLKKIYLRYLPESEVTQLLDF
ncbi:transporter substrate-binding domain-containing protein [Chitinibacter bivalviorum]|uniref:Transporter substrate-binding domain-containing protein n=1 Tax=Chitinibacter bivalviorum TaxID=2739434 RepID=A0A7H9BM01_9NEIS|nr:transporter substrate-binding domain-containing protein [Chitinibacter bivalviorum]QLG89472.1 transporter substrate-binding domain-containing protein [Chitinibacter bivalviorum]